MERGKFKVVFSNAARSDIEKLEIDDSIRVAKDIKQFLETDPLPIGKTR